MYRFIKFFYKKIEESLQTNVFNTTNKEKSKDYFITAHTISQLSHY